MIIKGHSQDQLNTVNPPPPQGNWKIYPPALEVDLDSLISVIAFLASKTPSQGPFWHVFNDLIVVYVSPLVIFLSLLNIHNIICGNHGLL